MEVIRLHPWVVFYISCRYPSILIPALVRCSIPEWSEVLHELTIRFPQPYCAILKGQLENLKEDIIDGKSGTLTHGSCILAASYLIKSHDEFSNLQTMCFIFWDVVASLENLVETCCGNGETIRLGKIHFQKFVTTENLRLFYPFFSQLKNEKRVEFVWTMLSSLSWPVIKCVLDFIAEKTDQNAIQDCRTFLNFIGEASELDFLKKM